jgi:hypothetical protein
MDLTKSKVDSILEILILNNYIKSEDWYASPDIERKGCAEYWIEEAHKAWKENKRVARNDEAIRTILNIFPPEEVYIEPKVTDNLPIPKEPDFEYTQLPADYTTLTDLEIRKYSSHNQHYLNRAAYLLSSVSNHFDDANYLKDDAYRKAYVRFNDELEAAGERTTKDLIDSYVRTQDEEFKKYDKDAKLAKADMVQLKALVEIYKGNVDRLSREWSMRQQEWEKGR